MIRDILQSIPGIEIFPVIGLILFVLVFAGVIYWTFFKLSKKHAEEMGRLPLE